MIDAEHVARAVCAAAGPKGASVTDLRLNGWPRARVRMAVWQAIDAGLVDLDGETWRLYPPHHELMGSAS